MQDNPIPATAQPAAVEAVAGGNQACAACRFQRKKCTAKCPLAPFFPAEKSATFRNFHRLFGVKKVLKLLEKMPPEKKSVTMKTLIFQADMRNIEPVHGCTQIISNLGALLFQAEFELSQVQSHLESCRRSLDPNAAAIDGGGDLSTMEIQMEESPMKFFSPLPTEAAQASTMDILQPPLPALGDEFQYENFLKVDENLCFP